jgi:hypothetical protein
MENKTPLAHRFHLLLAPGLRISEFGAFIIFTASRISSKSSEEGEQGPSVRSRKPCGSRRHFLHAEL